MIDRNHALPITRQAKLVGISRGDVYYQPRAASQADQRLMKRIDPRITVTLVEAIPVSWLPLTTPRLIE